MQKEDAKFQQSNIFEGMSSISALLHAIEAGLHDRSILKVWFDQDKIHSKSREYGYLMAMSKRYGFPVCTVEANEIDSLTVGSTHGGIIAFCTDRTIPSLTADRIIQNGVYFMLDGVEDPYNFGNAVRSLYASGVDGIIVPSRNWMGASGVVARSSAGTSELCPMLCAEDTLSAVSLFKSIGYTVACAGIRNSESLFDISLSKPLFVIIGGERRGISRSVLDQADHIVRIDYGREFRGSLSASSSAAVFGFEILRKLQHS